jgi:hypothetical protein
MHHGAGLSEEERQREQHAELRRIPALAQGVGRPHRRVAPMRDFQAIRRDRQGLTAMTEVI